MSFYFILFFCFVFPVSSYLFYVTMLLGGCVCVCVCVCVCDCFFIPLFNVCLSP